jgi:hypothetical protein
VAETSLTAFLIAVLILVWIVATAAALVFAFRRELVRAWNEPVLTAPVLIIESDDWGFGPPEQAERLREIAALLARHRDRTGRAPVMTLGVILAGPDTARIAAEGCRAYRRLMLNDAPLDAVRNSILAGARQGVLAPQLHGMEHFSPAVLLRAAASDRALRHWLTAPGLPATEALPAHLQSRWTDASRLPSQELPPEEVAQAVREETEAFQKIFGAAPEVVVPPTFLWTRQVERAWLDAGVRVLITPGRRYAQRDRDGKLVPRNGAIHNAERAPSGLTYLVRKDYFEPMLGHSAERALAALRANTRLGRPTLLETHRANFLGDKAAHALAELDRLLAEALAGFAHLRFMSSAELARHYQERTAVVEQRLLPRLHCFVLRLRQISRLRKLAWASGLALPAALLCAATRHTRTT